MIAVLQYLLRDSWSRWYEQPASPLARILVVWVLVSTSIVILLAFFIMEKEVQKRLTAIGGNVVLIQETITPSSLSIEKVPFADKLKTLSEYGPFYTFKKIFTQGLSEENQRLPIYIYENKDLGFIFENSRAFVPPDGRQHSFYFTNKYPEGTLIAYQFDQVWKEAVVLQPTIWSERLEPNGMLLTPAILSESLIENGYVSRTLCLIDHQEQLVNMVAAIKAFLKNESNHRGVRIDDPSNIFKESESLQSYQLLWRSTLSTIFGFVLCLVFLAIGWLEFRQSKYVGALLISMGTPQRYLRIRDLLENMILANFGVLIACVGLWSLLPLILDSLGLGENQSILLSKEFLLQDGLILLVMVNVAACVGCAASWIGISQDEGYVLS